MKVILNYWNRQNKSVVTESGFRYRDTTSIITDTKEITSTTEIELFEQFYKLNNRLRYCNGSYYTFVEPEWETKYNDWLSSDDYKSKSFNLYYGNGIVD